MSQTKTSQTHKSNTESKNCSKTVEGVGFFNFSWNIYSLLHISMLLYNNYILYMNLFCPCCLLSNKNTHFWGVFHFFCFEIAAFSIIVMLHLHALINRGTLTKKSMCVMYFEINLPAFNLSADFVFLQICVACFFPPLQNCQPSVFRTTPFWTWKKKSEFVSFAFYCYTFFFFKHAVDSWLF